MVVVTAGTRVVIAAAAAVVRVGAAVLDLQKLP